MIVVVYKTRKGRQIVGNIMVNYIGTPAAPRSHTTAPVSQDITERTRVLWVTPSPQAARWDIGLNVTVLTE